MSNNFISALIQKNIEAIKKAPKTDYHNHSIFGTRLERVESWLGLDLMRPPSKMNGLDGMRAYTKQVLYPYIRSCEGFEFTAESAILDAIDDGVVILDISFSVNFASFYPDKERGFMSFLKSLQTKYGNRITLRSVLGFPLSALQVREHLARRCIETGISIRLICPGMKQL